MTSVKFNFIKKILHIMHILVRLYTYYKLCVCTYYRYFSFPTHPVICTIIGKVIGTRCVVTITLIHGRQKHVRLSLAKCPSKAI